MPWDIASASRSFFSTVSTSGNLLTLSAVTSSGSEYSSAMCLIAST